MSATPDSTAESRFVPVVSRQAQSRQGPNLLKISNAIIPLVQWTRGDLPLATISLLLEVSFDSLQGWIQGQRLALLPHEASRHDTVLKWTEVFVVRLRSLETTIDSSATDDAYIATRLAYGYCAMLLEYLLGTTDNYVSNEIFVRDLTAEQIWQNLVDIITWEKYYGNVGHPPSGPKLKKSDKLASRLSDSRLYSPRFGSLSRRLPTPPGRLEWRAWQGGDEETALDVYHAWIIENTEWGVARILTQESQIGKPTAQLGATRPNPMLLEHQDWIDGFAKFTKGG